jgi:DNA-binding transcriptional MocR family regulator
LVIGLAKLISPSMRVSYVIAPDRQKAARLAELLGVTMQAAAPLEAALSTQLINKGLLQRLIGQIRTEARLRQQIAIRILSEYQIVAPPDGLFIWLRSPEQ